MFERPLFLTGNNTISVLLFEKSSIFNIPGAIDIEHLRATKLREARRIPREHYIRDIHAQAKALATDTAKDIEEDKFDASLLS